MSMVTNLKNMKDADVRGLVHQMSKEPLKEPNRVTVQLLIGLCPLCFKAF